LPVISLPPWRPERSTTPRTSSWIGEVVETVLGVGHSLVYLEGGFSPLPRPLSAA
jgi:hypothetical protein